MTVAADHAVAEARRLGISSEVTARETSRAAARRIVVVVDGIIATAAALVAADLCPAVRGYLVAAHRSVEVGHPAALQQLELEPLVALDLRLGEGSGAALVLPILDAALALVDEMATFEEAGIAAARGTGSSNGLVPDV